MLVHFGRKEKDPCRRQVKDQKKREKYFLLAKRVIVFPCLVEFGDDNISHHRNDLKRRSRRSRRKNTPYMETTEIKLSFVGINCKNKFNNIISGRKRIYVSTPNLQQEAHIQVAVHDCAVGYGWDPVCYYIPMREKQPDSVQCKVSDGCVSRYSSRHKPQALFVM